MALVRKFRQTRVTVDDSGIAVRAVWGSGNKGKKGASYERFGHRHFVGVVL